jgi:hypothetical protein
MLLCVHTIIPLPPQIVATKGVVVDTRRTVDEVTRQFVEKFEISYVSECV